ncbi:galectin-4 isoform X1 [Erythrolamprus reginae]|uniref:galectin-4 isoform X1 n=1 Tax=Erythrolamprus reginae TaxID=121349 RepID=UPI00396C6E48
MTYCPAPGYNPVYNPTLPYHQPVPGGLRPGMSVYVQGTVPKHTNRFRVNFACGQHEGADIAFHFNPRFDGKDKTVLNTFQSGRWGNEEIHKMPFRKGEHFEIIFVVNDAGYQVLVNRNPFCSYGHRLPPQSVQVVSADGDLELQSLTVMGGSMMGNMGMMQNPGYGPAQNLPMMQSPALYHPTVPKHIESIRLTFQVDFACGQHEGADIPFHFNPLFIKNRVLLNTFQLGRWEKAKKYKNPFRKGLHFEIIFIVNEGEYQILVNGSLFGTYKHRIPPQIVQVISATGNLEVQSLVVMGRPVMEMPITNPAFYYPLVPYTGNIPGGLGVNKTITM